MSQSLTNILVHIIFSTKDRQSLINQRVEDRLHAYMAAVFKEFLEFLNKCQVNYDERYIWDYYTLII